MRILFIGGTGNLSGECAALLHEKGHEIAVLTRGRGAVPHTYQHLLADRGDRDAIKTALGNQQFDAVLNFLGFDLDDVGLDFDFFHDRTRQYLFISSATVYAKPIQKLPLTEESPVGNDTWDYARKKLECEQWLQRQYRENGFPVTIVRPSHTFGRRWIPNPFSSSSYTFAARMEQGKPVFIPDARDNPWTLTAATDFAAAVAGLVGNTRAVGEVFHITSDEALTWNDIYAEIAAALGVTSPQIVRIPTDFICEIVPAFAGPLKGDKTHPAVFDNAKIKRFVPGWQCRKTVHEALRESVEWLKAHPEARIVDAELDRKIDEVITEWRRHTVQ